MPHCSFHSAAVSFLNTPSLGSGHEVFPCLCMVVLASLTEARFPTWSWPPAHGLVMFDYSGHWLVTALFRCLIWLDHLLMMQSDRPAVTAARTPGQSQPASFPGGKPGRVDKYFSGQPLFCTLWGLSGSPRGEEVRLQPGS